MQGDAAARSVLRSGTFRFALLFAAIFALGSMLVLFTVQHQIEKYAEAATEGTLSNETGILAAEYSALGLPGLTGAIARRSTGKDPQFRFRLTDRDGRLLAGDLPRTTRTEGTGALRLREVDLAVQGERVETFKTLSTALPDGLHLVVATDTFDVQRLMERLRSFTLACGICISLFALVGGYFVGSLFMRRLEGVNMAVNRIMAGALEERLPSIGLGPEFDELSSNLNRMLDRIQNLMEGLRQVSTDIAHDLRTPLTRLHQQLEGLKGLADAKDYDAGIEAALVQTENILSIFRALLRIGSLEGGVGRSRLAVIDLSEVVERVGAAYEPVVEDAGRTLSIDISPGISVIGDGELLAQATINLIENALTHASTGTFIQLRLTASPSHASISVCDDGPGIPAEEREKVIERFYRLDSSRSTPGSGLGLALVQAIARMHQADLRLADNRPGLAASVDFRRA